MNECNHGQIAAENNLGCPVIGKPLIIDYFPITVSPVVFHIVTRC